MQNPIDLYYLQCNYCSIWRLAGVDGIALVSNHRARLWCLPCKQLTHHAVMPLIVMPSSEGCGASHQGTQTLCIDATYADAIEWGVWCLPSRNSNTMQWCHVCWCHLVRTAVPPLQGTHAPWSDATYMGDAAADGSEISTDYVRITGAQYRWQWGRWMEIWLSRLKVFVH